MYKFKRAVFGLVGLFTLIGIATVTIPHIGRGASGSGSSAPTSQIQNVKVVNAGTEPVPIQGSATVSGTVQAQQSGTWNVGINGTPTFALDAGNNTVKIDTAAPVSVRDVDNPARQPFQTSLFVPLPDGTSFVATNANLQPPAGKRLVIERVSLLANLPTGQKPACSLQVTNNADVVFYQALPLNLQGTFGPIDTFLASVSTRLYLDSSQETAFDVFRTAATGTAGVRVSFSGYFVDLQ